MKKMKIAAMVGGVLGFGFMALFVQASSQEVWKEFHEDVEQKCVAFYKSRPGNKEFKKSRIYTLPHGTQSFGIAIIEGDWKDPWKKEKKTMKRSFLCLYDKSSKKVVEFEELVYLSSRDGWKDLK